jgi:uncharacterized membrane protein YphA (DoxX/SURF4 family)
LWSAIVVTTLEPTSPSDRGLAGRVAFRFLFVYLLVYDLPFAVTWIPGTAGLVARTQELWALVVPWVGRHFLHLRQAITPAPTGSADRTFDYVQVFCTVAMAALAALAWTLWEARRRRSPSGSSRSSGRLQEGLRIYLRYTLALILLTAGMGMALKVQFPSPTIERLQERIGDSSPLTFYSVFMGYSTSYCVFCGAMEALAGLLLLFRRTTTLGALLAVAVTSHAAALDLSYDVPQKLLSLHLLLISGLLLAPDLRRLVDGLVLDRPTSPADLGPADPGQPPSGPRARRARLALKTLVVAYALAAATRQGLAQRQQQMQQAPRPPFDGVWEVTRFVRDGREVPLWGSDLSRWRRLIANSPRRLVVGLRNGVRQSFTAAYGPHEVTLFASESGGKPGKGGPQGALAWAGPGPDQLVLRGTVGGESLVVELSRFEPTYLLTSRGFRLVDDDPINR